MKAADKGHAESMLSYAKLLNQQNSRKANKYFKSAADKGNIEAMMIYAEKLYEGKNCSINKREGATYYKKDASKQ